MDLPDQMANGLDVNLIQRDGASVRFAMTALNASFAGALATDRQSIAGQWTQGGTATPLTLTRRAPGFQPAALLRPQTPVKPYPYREEEVAFDQTAHVRLAGTLTLPRRARGRFRRWCWWRVRARTRAMNRLWGTNFSWSSPTT